MVLLLGFLALATGGHGQARGRESARLPFYCPLHVDAKAGVAFVAGRPENLETWDLHVWREGRQPVKIMSAEGLIASLSASPDGSSVLVCDLTHPAGSGGADVGVTWVHLSRAPPATKEFHRELIMCGAAWDPAGARWVAYRQRDGYVIHSGRGETALVAPQFRSRVRTETYWLPDSSESAYVVKADGTVYRISGKTESLVTQVRLRDGARIAARGHSLLVVSDRELMCVDLERGTTTTRPLAGEAKQLRHLRAAVPLGDEWLGLVAGAGGRSDEAGVFLLRRRDASVEFLAKVAVEPELVEMAGDEQGLCVAWPDLAKRETTLRWFDLPK